MHQYFALYINTLILHKCSQLHINAVFTILSYHRRPVRWHQNNWSVFLGFGRDWPEPRISCGVMIWNCVHTTSAIPSFSVRENKREATWAHVVFNPLPQEKHFHISGPAESRVPLIKTASEGTFMWPHKVFVLIIKKKHFCEGLSIEMYIRLQIPHAPSPARLWHTLSSLSNEKAATMRGSV